MGGADHFAIGKGGFPSDLIAEVPDGFLEILDGLGAVVLEVGSPNVFHGVAEVESHVAGDLDALDAAGV